MAVKVNESDEKMVKEFFSDINTAKELKGGKGVDDVDEKHPQSYVVKVGSEGIFKMGFRRRRDYSKLQDEIKSAWRNAIERSKENIVKKFDALGFSMEKMADDKKIDIELAG